MSSNFNKPDFQVKEEPQSGGAPRVMKVEQPLKSVISDFKMPKLKKDGEGQYTVTKARYGALAITDPGHTAKEQKDRSFNLSPLVREPLAVEEEERRAINERVQAALAVQAEKVKEEARQQGYREGLEKGYSEAFQRFQAEGSERLARFESLIGELEGAKNEIYQANERMLIDLVYRVARMVLLRELTTDKEFVARLTRELVERIGVRENIRIRLSPEDMSSVEMIREGIEKSLGSMKNLNFEASKDVAHGGCIVETEWNMIDASVETQLQGIFEGLMGPAATAAGTGSGQ